MPASADEIANFKAIAGDYIHDYVAIQYIDNSGSLADAIGKIFDEPELYTIQTYQHHLQQQQQSALWDEGLIGQDRSGQDQIGSGIPAFQIHAADDSIASNRTIRPTDNSNAPTRPPSRMSMRDGQTGQESGILGSTGNPFIGPAPRDYYNPAQWALVPSTSAAEILLDPDPDQRQRDTSKGEPVFMKPLPNKDPLASLITILGHIPLARNSLVAGPTLANYGSSPDWWKGAKIELSVISHEEEEHFRLSYELLEETQRLMAFMHSSTRSYGSVQPLSELKAVTNVKSGMAEFKTLADRFLAAWSDASIALSLLPPNLPNLFLTKALQLSANGKKDEIPFYIIDIKLGPTDTTAPTRTLYDGADGLLWAEDLDGTMDDNYCLEEIPPVLAMRVLNQDASNTGLDMEVLETWYLDRYLKKNMIAAKTMRNQRSNYTKELQNIEERRKKFLRIKHPKGDKEFEAKELIASTIKYLNPPKPTDKENAKPGESSNENAPAQEPQSVEQLRSVELANQLAGILEKVDKKLKDLDVEREKTQATMAELSRLFTDPNSEERRPEHRYNLRGVSIGPDHVEHFVLVDPTTKQEASQHEDGATDLAARSQWWRIEYLYTGLHKQPTEIENVLRAASATRDVMLVYATDDACERKEFDPADALRSFVEKDNELFSEEVAEHLPNSMQAELTYQVDEEPPAYEQALQPNDGRWVNIGEEMSMGWTPDPGLGVLSDAEYRYNTSQYADFNASSSGKGAGDEDVRMGGLAVERIEDVTDEGRLKGG